MIPSSSLQYKMDIKSEYLELRTSKLGGQGLFAVKDISSGTIIVNDENIATSQNFSDKDYDKYFEDISGFDKLKIANLELALTAVIAKNLKSIKAKFGNDWSKYLYKLGNCKKKLNKKHKRCITEISSKYKVSYDFVVDIYDMIGCNSFDTLNLNAENVYISLGFVISKINHSCNPNCSFLIFPNRNIVFALRDIPKDTEITISYGDDYFTDRNMVCKCGECDKTPIESKRDPSTGFDYWFQLIIDLLDQMQVYSCDILMSLCLKELFAIYIRSMTKILSNRFSVSELDVIIYFGLRTQISHQLLNGVLNLRVDEMQNGYDLVNPTFDWKIDVEKIKSTIHS